MSNRVEELESKVKELQAAVNGLTEELVEAKARVQKLEEEVEIDVATGRRQQSAAAEEEQVEADKVDDAKGEDDEEKSSGSDIIVA